MSLLKLITFVLVVVFGGGKEFISPPLSAPLFKKKSVLLSNSKRKNHPEILTCLIALIIFIKRLI